MPSFQVVEFHPDQTIIETTRTPEQLHLQPRDISIFATNKLGVQAQRATISPRNGAVLFRTEIAKAIIYKDRAVLFHSRQASLVQSGACLVSMGGGQLQNLCNTSSVGVQSLLTSGASHVFVTSENNQSRSETPPLTCALSQQELVNKACVACASVLVTVLQHALGSH